MLGLLRSLWGNPAHDASPLGQANERHAPAAPPEEVSIDDRHFAVAAHLRVDNGLPHLEWRAARAWVEAQPKERQPAAWAACERAWLEHLRYALGAAYRIDEHRDACILSALDERRARAALHYVDATSRRVQQVLDGIAHVPEWGQDILLIFADEETYYRYIAHFYPESDGEYAFSSGIHLDAGCAHFATVEADFDAIEPVIAHEMAHGCVAHLPLPAWLNEGIATNVEQRLAPRARGARSPLEMRDSHRAFWDAARLQEFWSGSSFLRADEGCMLSYDMARAMVEQMSKDWESFRDFVLAADVGDAGRAAAQARFGVDLGRFVGAMLGLSPDAGDLGPSPSSWIAAPERGGF